MTNEQFKAIITLRTYATEGIIDKNDLVQMKNSGFMDKKLICLNTMEQEQLISAVFYKEEV